MLVGVGGVELQHSFEILGEGELEKSLGESLFWTSTCTKLRGLGGKNDHRGGAEI